MSGKRVVLLVGASSTLLVAYAAWRARRRAYAALDQAERMIVDGPLVSKELSTFLFCRSENLFVWVRS